MNDFDQVYAYVVVYGKGFSAKDLSVAIDLPPSCTGSSGSMVFSRGSEIIYWDYQTAEFDNQPEFESALLALCQVFEERTGCLLDFVRQYQLQVKLVIDITVQNNKSASLLLPGRASKLVHELGASVQFDVHCR